MKNRSRSPLTVVVTTVIVALIAAAGLVALPGCGTDTATATKSDSRVVTGEKAQAPATSAPGREADVKAPVQTEAPASEPQVTAPAPQPPAAESLTGDVAVDCPYYDDGVCTRTGKPCTGCSL